MCNGVPLVRPDASKGSRQWARMTYFTRGRRSSSEYNFVWKGLYRKRTPDTFYLARDVVCLENVNADEDKTNTDWIEMKLTQRFFMPLPLFIRNYVVSVP